MRRFYIIYIFTALCLFASCGAERSLKKAEEHLALGEYYDAAMFIDELKKQISDIVNDVLCDNSNRRVTIMSDEDMKKTAKKKKAAPKKKTKSEETAVKENKEKESKSTLTPSDELIGQICPVCGKGHIIKGKNAYGCSNWKEGCKFVLPFE